MNQSFTKLLLSGLVVCSSALADGDTLYAWALFRDKPLVKEIRIADRSLLRRKTAGFDRIGLGDFPVSEVSVAAVEAAGGRIRQRSAWLNAVSFSGSFSAVAAVARLGSVRAVVPVARWSRLPPVATSLLRKTVAVESDPWYGLSYNQLALVGVPDAQRAAGYLTGALPGHGVLIAFFDSGFLLDHKCFQRLQACVVADSDFVDNDGDVGNPDQDGRSHGATTLSLVGGYDPGTFVGAAWDARFVLARTEDDFSERHVEEDNWIAALEWSERLGVDVINSSLGYRYGFDSADIDYPFSSLDGHTTMISMAADSAARRGLLIVNSMGNEGSAHGDSSVNAPADAEAVVSVGAIGLDLVLAGFSSRGPTADGRIKPDVVAPGLNVTIPRIGSFGQYTNGAGTSYSAPIVTGILALMKQCANSISADSLRLRLVTSCRYAPGQQEPDNLYGHGIPDALHSILGERAFLRVTGANGTAISGSQVSWDGTVRARTDSAGVAIFAIPDDSIPGFAEIRIDEHAALSLPVDTLPTRLSAVFASRVILSILSTDGEPVSGAVVTWHLAGGTKNMTTVADNAGQAPLPHYSGDSVVVSVCAPAYRCSAPVIVVPDTGVVSVVVTLTPVGFRQLKLFPTIVHLSSGHPELTVQFVADRDQEPLVVGVRTVTGSLVWESVLRPALYQTVSLPISCQSSVRNTWAAGTYFVVIRYRGDTIVRKVFLVG